MTGGEIMILGKLVLTFGLLLGLPIWDLVRMERRRRASGRARAPWPPGVREAGEERPGSTASAREERGGGAADASRQAERRPAGQRGGA